MLPTNHNNTDASVAGASAKRRTVIFTDLDGTLLDHHTYGFDAAAGMLDYLKSRHIPLVIVTSKTRPEVLKLQRRLGISEAFIVENGAGAFIPPGSVLFEGEGSDASCEAIAETKSYGEVRAFFEGLKPRYGVEGFGDMTLEKVIALTGLPAENARDAMARDFTEPFILPRREDFPRIREAARREGFDVIEGGRFFHLITRGATKGEALKALAARYAVHYGRPVRTIALGDSANDITMLQEADDAVQIPHPDGSYEAMGIPGSIQAPYPGPKGWNAALRELLDVR